MNAKTLVPDFNEYIRLLEEFRAATGGEKITDAERKEWFADFRCAGPTKRERQMNDIRDHLCIVRAAHAAGKERQS
jgi:hypothetical protein